MTTTPGRPGRLFTSLAFATAFLTAGLIVFGLAGVVLVSGLGLTLLLRQR